MYLFWNLIYDTYEIKDSNIKHISFLWQSVWNDIIYIMTISVCREIDNLTAVRQSHSKLWTATAETTYIQHIYRSYIGTQHFQL